MAAQSPGEGQGATFTVTLPLGSGVPARTTPPSAPASAAPVRSLAGLRVLIVEDEDDARDLLVTVLEGGQADARAVAAADEALEVLAEFQPDVVISDIRLPGTDGYQLLARLRAGGVRVPALALTAYASVQDGERALAAGFQAHLAKPIDPDRLLAALARLIG